VPVRRNRFIKLAGDLADGVQEMVDLLARPSKADR
jgi:hypothetical protein